MDEEQDTSLELYQELKEGSTFPSFEDIFLAATKLGRREGFLVSQREDSLHKRHLRAMELKAKESPEGSCTAVEDGKIVPFPLSFVG